MVKLKSFQAYRTEDTPDYILQEIEDVSTQIAEKITPLMDEHHGNIVLAALSFHMAAAIKYYVSEAPEEIRNATKCYALSLMKNVEMLTKVDVFDKK